MFYIVTDIFLTSKWPNLFQSHECSLVVQGARQSDSGQWTCEVGDRAWAMAGEVTIRVIREQEEVGEREGLTGVIQVIM